MARYPYSYEIEIPHYDCDPYERLKPSSVLRYMQVAAEWHLDSVGLTHARLLGEGMVFVVSATALRVIRAPKAGERIRVATAPVAKQGAHMLRETVLLDPGGQVLVEGQSSWVLIEPESSRLLRASDFPYAMPMLEGDWDPFANPAHIHIHAGSNLLEEREVRLSDLDHNHHMNNSVYADILLDCFAGAFLASGGVDTLFLRYRAQARLQDVLTLQGGVEGGLYSVSAQLGTKKCFEGAFSLKTP